MGKQSNRLSFQCHVPSPFQLLLVSIFFLLKANPGVCFMISAERPSRITPLFSTAESAAEEAERLKEQARKLREEIEAFQEKKDNLEEEERQAIQKELDEKQAFIDRYSAVVPILKPDGTTVEENVQFPPTMGTDGDSIIKVFTAPLPLGIILGESEEIPVMTVVDEIQEGSNGEIAGGKGGDVDISCGISCSAPPPPPTPPEPP